MCGQTYFQLKMDPGNCFQLIDSNKVINFITCHSLQYIHLQCHRLANWSLLCSIVSRHNLLQAKVDQAWKWNIPAVHKL